MVAGTHHTGLSLLNEGFLAPHRGTTLNDALIHTEDDAEVFLYGGEREQRHSPDPLPYISAEPASSSKHHMEVP